MQIIAAVKLFFYSLYYKAKAKFKADTTVATKSLEEYVKAGNVETVIAFMDGANNVKSAFLSYIEKEITRVKGEEAILKAKLEALLAKL